MVSIETVTSATRKNQYSIINTRDRYIEINNIKYPFPKKIKGYNCTQDNGKIYIDGYEFKNGKFKRTLKAIWRLFF